MTVYGLTACYQSLFTCKVHSHDYLALRRCSKNLTFPIHSLLKNRRWMNSIFLIRPAITYIFVFLHALAFSCHVRQSVQATLRRCASAFQWPPPHGIICTGFLLKFLVEVTLDNSPPRFRLGRYPPLAQACFRPCKAAHQSPVPYRAETQDHPTRSPQLVLQRCPVNDKLLAPPHDQAPLRG